MTTIADQFQIDCAVMAGAAYVSNRNPINQLPVPPGWALVNYVSLTSGFEGAAFTNGSQIVISYTGTNPASWNDLVADLALGIGAGSTQLDQAVDFYLQTAAANPGVPISFTGHSLGGGLASLLAVFFNRQAVTFDQAPFAAAASSAVAELRAGVRSCINTFSSAILVSWHALYDLNWPALFTTSPHGAMVGRIFTCRTLTGKPGWPY